MLNMVPFFLNTILYRVIEIIMLISFMALNTCLKWEIIHKKKITQQIIFYLTIVLLLFCVFEILFGLLLNFFPMMNLVIRCFVIILLNKKLREEWKKIFLIIYQTISISFILFFNLFMFSLIGHLIFQKDNNEFSTYFSSLDSMFILMTTCNFPDVMFRVLDISNFAILFFVCYIITNLFIFLSLLKVLIYTNYIELNKNRIFRIFKKISEFEIDFTEKDLNYISCFKQRYTLTDKEFEKFKGVLNLPYDNKRRLSLFSIDSTASMSSQLADEEEKKKRSKLLRLIRMKRVEIIVNIVNLLIIGLAIINQKNIAEYIIQDLMFIYFIAEYVLYIRYYSFNKLVRHKMLRTMFCGINLLGLVVMTYLIIHNLTASEENRESIVIIGRTLAILRSTRIFILLNTFNEYKTIFTTLRQMKGIFFKLIAIQFSFMLIFSTVSMTFLGGKIKNDQYVNSKTIPEYYTYINFNTFGTSFMTCFSFMLINNTNIQTEALSLVAGGWFRGYFTIYYFLGTVVMLNVFQTIILEMYVNIKKSKNN